MNSNQRVIIKIALIGILSALCYVAVMFSIPIPSPLGKPMIHFGNLIVIISALLLVDLLEKFLVQLEWDYMIFLQGMIFGQSQEQLS